MLRENGRNMGGGSIFLKKRKHRTDRTAGTVRLKTCRRKEQPKLLFPIEF